MCRSVRDPGRRASPCACAGKPTAGASPHPAGDPRTATFDGAFHDFFESGEYWYARTCAGQFDVQGRLFYVRSSQRSLVAPSLTRTCGSQCSRPGHTYDPPAACISGVAASIGGDCQVMYDSNKQLIHFTDESGAMVSQPHTASLPETKVREGTARGSQLRP